MTQERYFERREEAQEFARTMALCGAAATCVTQDGDGWVCEWVNGSSAEGGE
jgi:NAD(P)H-hydrate repair Nnr-like enzyme with NAD(P)H-hydrate dehydratase domain